MATSASANRWRSLPRVASQRRLGCCYWEESDTSRRRDKGVWRLLSAQTDESRSPPRVALVVQGAVMAGLLNTVAIEDKAHAAARHLV